MAKSKILSFNLSNTGADVSLKLLVRLLSGEKIFFSNYVGHDGYKNHKFYADFKYATYFCDNMPQKRPKAKKHHTKFICREKALGKHC
jgi:hypothetical protein